MSDSAQTSAKLEFWDLNFEYIEVSLNDDKKCKFVHASAISKTLQYEKLLPSELKSTVWSTMINIDNNDFDPAWLR